MLLLLNKFRAGKHMGENRRKKEWPQKTAKKIRRAALCHTFILFGGSMTTTISRNINYSSSSSSNNNF